MAPSPKNGTATRGSPRSMNAFAAPHAMGAPAPTIPFAPKIPSEKSAMCIEPPRPRLYPVSRPSSSANMRVGSPPLARM